MRTTREGQSALLLFDVVALLLIPIAAAAEAAPDSDPA